MRSNLALSELYDESIVGQNWVARSLDLVERLPLDRPAPAPWQTSLPADFSVYLPGFIGGELVAAEAVIAAQVALDALASGIDPKALELIEKALRVYSPSAHGTFAVDVAAGATVKLFDGSKQRSYCLIVNSGANDAFLAYGKDADARSLPLASGGDGFHELVHGTRSSASVFAAAATTIIVVDGRYDPELGDDEP